MHDLTAEMKEWNNLTVIPLTLQIGDYVIQDDENFNQDDFIRRMTKSSTVLTSSSKAVPLSASSLIL